LVEGRVIEGAEGRLRPDDIPPLPFTEPVLVQLSVEGGACFEAEYPPASFVNNEPSQFMFKGGAPVP
jgi:hypothetical protein